MAKSVFALLLIIALGAHSAVGAERAIHPDVPTPVDPAARYLFHLHGRAVELQGATAKTPFGSYLYNDVVGALADRGFIVISEVRPPTTQLAPYAVVVAAQVAKLLEAGVPPENITVTGFSGGGAIALLATAAIGNPRVNFVLMAGCLLGSTGRTVTGLLAVGRPPQGRVLSIYDEGDTNAGSCATQLADKLGVTFTEVVLSTRAAATACS
jgi:hypothetical protein